MFNPYGWYYPVPLLFLTHGWVSFLRTNMELHSHWERLWQKCLCTRGSSPSLFCCVMPLLAHPPLLWVAWPQIPASAWSAHLGTKQNRSYFGEDMPVYQDPQAGTGTWLGKHSGCFKVIVIAYCGFLFCLQEIIKLMIPFPGKPRNSINFTDSS